MAACVAAVPPLRPARATPARDVAAAAAGRGPQQRGAPGGRSGPGRGGGAPGGGRGGGRYQGGGGGGGGGGRQQGRRYGGDYQQQQQREQQRPRLFQGGGAAAAPPGPPPPDVPAMLLTRQITACADWRQLQGVLDGKLPALNAVHVSAALHQLSRAVGPRGAGGLAEGDGRAVALLAGALLERAEDADVRSALGGQEISCCLGALARLGLHEPRHAAALLELSEGRLGGFRNREMLHLGWAAARLGLEPGAGWLEEFHDETYMRMPSLNEQELGNAVWAFAKLGRRPSAAWLSRLLAHLPSRAVRMEPPAICSTLWAAAMMGLELPAALVDAVLLESQVKFPAFNAHGLATLAWSLCSLDVRPRRLWLDDYVVHTGTRMAGWSNDQCFTNTLWALSNWEHRPPDAWLDECCRLALPFLEGMSLKSLLILATALADLDYCPPLQWSSLLLERAHARHAQRAAAGGGGQGGADAAADLATFLWALSRLLRRPRAGGGWAGGGGGRRAREPEQGAGEGSGAAAAAEGPSATWLRHYRPLLQDLADAVTPGMAALPVTALVDAAVGCADLRLFPGVAWMDAHEAAVNDSVADLSAYQVNLVQRAYAALEAAHGGGGDGGGGSGAGAAGAGAAGAGAAAAAAGPPPRG
ncbi:MAG: hypothetical protein J3K34DRAFT_520429 [Monoraphidium minutum]|nr:MAG: hypothetical protein J3K34DRAFT_520429 [Monoraphidium minutum]